MRNGIRAAAAGDLGGIQQVDHLASHGDADRAEMLRQSLDVGACQVHLDDGSVTGFVVVKPVSFFGRDFIELLTVDHSRRRSGIGRALLRAAVSGAGTDEVFTSTNMSNVAMQSLLESEGWSFSGKLDGLDEGDPELVFFTTGRAGHRP
jgi:ribosomal protein S18 acetylase RimI-like enzyme